MRKNAAAIEAEPVRSHPRLAETVAAARTMAAVHRGGPGLLKGASRRPDTSAMHGRSAGALTKARADFGLERQLFAGLSDDEAASKRVEIDLIVR